MADSVAFPLQLKRLKDDGLEVELLDIARDKARHVIAKKSKGNDERRHRSIDSMKVMKIPKFA